MPELIKCKTLITYIIEKIRATSLYAAADKALRYARRFMLVTRILGYIRIAAAIIETSALLILLAAVIVVLIPLILIALAVFAAADFLIGRRLLHSSELASALKRDRVYVIAETGQFGDGFAGELAGGGAAVFVITASPSEHFICAVRRGGVYYVRHAFFFRLKRRLLMSAADKTVYLM